MAHIGLRDKRRPGHCWQDNELYDAFLPIIGPTPTHIYAHATRHCYGSSAKFSLREIAEGSGASKDTVRRALLVMQAIGMLRARGGSPGRAAEYDLVDLKELAEHLGAEFERKRSSYVFSAEITARLKRQVAEVLAKTQGKDGAPVNSSTVSQRDSLFVEKASELSLGRDATVSPEVETVSPEGQPTYIQNTRHQDTPSPTPIRKRTGGCSEILPSRQEQIRKAASDVCAFCDVSDARFERRLCDAIDAYSAKHRMSPGEVAIAMIAAKREFDAHLEWFRYRWGLRAFYMRGHWAQPHTWPYDDEKIRRSQGASIGLDGLRVVNSFDPG